MGMDRAQLQMRIVLPLAVPIIVAGVRVAAVTTVGIAVIGAWVGVHDIGFLIYQATTAVYDPNEILAGAIVITLFAIVVDLLLLALQAALGRGRQIVPAT